MVEIEEAHDDEHTELFQHPRRMQLMTMLEARVATKITGERSGWTQGHDSALHRRTSSYERLKLIYPAKPATCHGPSRTVRLVVSTKDLLEVLQEEGDAFSRPNLSFKSMWQFRHRLM